jgi:hypothetical protein
MKWPKKYELTLTSEEEKALLETGKQVLSTEFPNPERLGCPSPEIFKKLVYRPQSLTLKERERWLDHATACSPCFNAFSSLRDGFVKKKRARRSIAVVALGVALLSWYLFKTSWHQPPAQPIIVKEAPAPAPEPAPPRSVPPSVQEQRPAEAQVAVLDLRLRGVARGGNNSRDGDLELPKGLLKLSIYLPIGSEEGNYEVRISGRQKRVITTKGKAAMRDHRNVLTVEIDASSLDPGKYSLAIRQHGWGWTTYPLRLK